MIKEAMTHAVHMQAREGSHCCSTLATSLPRTLRSRWILQCNMSFSLWMSGAFDPCGGREGLHEGAHCGRSEQANSDTERRQERLATSSRAGREGAHRRANLTSSAGQGTQLRAGRLAGQHGPVRPV